MNLLVIADYALKTVIAETDAVNTIAVTTARDISNRRAFWNRTVCPHPLRITDALSLETLAVVTAAATREVLARLARPAGGALAGALDADSVSRTNGRFAGTLADIAGLH